jgi:hypothetical protein
MPNKFICRSAKRDDRGYLGDIILPRDLQLAAYHLDDELEEDEGWAAILLSRSIDDAVRR